MAAIRTMTMMISRSPKAQQVRSAMSIDTSFIDKLKRMIPLLIENYDDAALHANDANLVESQLADLSDYELGSNQSVCDKQLVLKREHLRRAARDCITAIADGIGYANVRNIMKPIVDTFDSKSFWVPSTFPKILMHILLRSNFVRNNLPGFRAFFVYY